MKQFNKKKHRTIQNFLYVLGCCWLTQFSQIDAKVGEGGRSVAKKEPLATSLSVYKDVALLRKIHPLASQAGMHSLSITGIPVTWIPESLLVNILPDNKKTKIIDYTIDPNSSDSGLVLQLGINSSDTTTDSQHQLELIYLFTNFSWQINYVAELSPTCDSLHFNGWVELKNKSGVSFEKVNVQLVDAPAPMRPLLKTTSSTAPSPLSSGKTESAPLQEKPQSIEPHSYVIPEAIDFRKDGDKRVIWVQAQDIKAKQDYRVFVGGGLLEDRDGKIEHPPIETWISFNNNSEIQEGLGQPLPGGMITIYQHDNVGGLEMLGQSTIPHIGSGQEISLKIPSTHSNKAALGSDIEINQVVSSNLEQTDYKRLSEKIIELGYHLTLTNKSEQAVSVRVILDLPNVEWTIVRETPVHQQTHPHEVFWVIDIPAKGESDLKYRLRLMKS